MGWVAKLIQMLPAILAALTQIWGVIGPLLNHQQSVAMAAAGRAVSATDYHLYVTGQAAGCTALALALASAQPTMNRAFGLLQKKVTAQQTAEIASELREQLDALPAAVQQAVVERRA